jgi:predicted Zn-dependent peptidase|tara:strand:+ start:213 stop:1421 length:1209 start_codon:yes stop_codon:yes gene_type:complete
MIKYRLKNGITVVFEKNNSKSVCVEVMFKVGSNYENEKEKGMSHFLEHMLFEGTKKRKTSREISNEIEKYGAEFNAYTSGNRTAFFIKIINKRFEKALEILSDMTLNSVFDSKMIEKEKNVISKEINMVADDPRQYQWILFQKNLFVKHPAKNPIAGSIKTVNAFTREGILDYYRRYYVSNNMIISIVGNVGEVRRMTEKYFGKLKKDKVYGRKYVKEPLQKKIKKVVEKRKILNSYMVLGYKTVSRLNKDSYVLDVINGILGRGQSGWMFDEIRNKHGLAYQVGVLLEYDVDCGYFAVFVGLDKGKIEKAKNLILKQFRKLEKISPKDLSQAKTYIEGNHILLIEDNLQASDNTACWEMIKDANLAKDYIKHINKVTVNDVRRAAKQYLNDKYTLVVIEQK